MTMGSALSAANGSRSVAIHCLKINLCVSNSMGAFIGKSPNESLATGAFDHVQKIILKFFEFRPIALIPAVAIGPLCQLEASAAARPRRCPAS
jgi:hypothetical protein